MLICLSAFVFFQRPTTSLAFEGICHFTAFCISFLQGFCPLNALPLSSISSLFTFSLLPVLPIADLHISISIVNPDLTLLATGSSPSAPKGQSLVWVMGKAVEQPFIFLSSFDFLLFLSACAPAFHHVD